MNESDETDEVIETSNFPRIHRAQTAGALQSTATPHPAKPRRPHTTKPTRYWLLMY